MFVVLFCGMYALTVFALSLFSSFLLLSCHLYGNSWPIGLQYALFVLVHSFCFFLVVVSVGL